MTKRRAMEGGGGSEFFICFTSRPSSSTSAAGGGGGGGIRAPCTKSLMSPGRNSATGPSLSSSLSRRLRNSGSVKGGGQSPMFPNSSATAIAVKKKGSGFEAVEPSSPKVTCIGQVRVKTKKKKKQNVSNANNINMNMLTRSASVSASRREASFRRSRSSAHGRGGGAGACLPGSGGRNQKWVHQLPITICETLRAFGSDFNCFLPSSCAGGGGGGGGGGGDGGGRSRGCYSFSDGGNKDHRKERSTTATTYPSTAASSTSTSSSSSSSSSCGAVFLRWLMAIQESEEDKGREVMRLMVEETEKGKVGFLLGDKTDFERKLQHEDKDKDEDEDDDDVVVKVEKEKEMVVVEGEEDVEKGRVSICIPPKNALLLMRCRSDPVRMAALANKFWGSPVLKIPCDKEAEEDNEEERVSRKLETDKDVHIYHVNEKKQAEQEKEKEKKTDLQAEQVLLKAGEVEKEVDVEVIDEEEILEGVVLNEPNIEREMLSQTDYEKASEEMENHPLVMDEEEEEERPVSKEEEREMLQGKQEVSADPLKKEDGKVEEEEETMEACDKELKDEAHSVQRQKEEDGEIKGGRRSTSNSGSNKGKGGEHPKTKEVAKRRSCYSNSSSKEKKERRRHSFSIERESRRNSFSSEREARRSSFSVDREGRRRWSFSSDKEELVPKRHPMLTSSDVEKQQKVDMPLTEEEAMEEIVRPPKVTLATQKMALTSEARDDEVVEKKKMMKKKKKGEEVQLQDGEKKRRDLPECLLLMMYEPKLSMEVSKETWVCSTDFLRWQPNHNPHPQPNQQSSKADDSKCCNESNKEVTAVTPDSAAVDPPPPPRPPPPAASPIVSGGCSGAVVLPQAAPYAPFVLTRCKSEPLKSSARLAPESCFWKSRHQPIGATGIGF